LDGLKDAKRETLFVNRLVGSYETGPTNYGEHMLKLWTKANRQWFAEDSRPSKANWRSLIEGGVIPGRIIAGTPYIEEDYLASTIVIANKTSGDMLNLLE